MNSTTNEFGQPIGLSVQNWKTPLMPSREMMNGRFCRLEPLDVQKHSSALFEADKLDAEGRSWTYLSYGPFAAIEDYRKWMSATCLGKDPMFFAIVDAKSNQPVGVASYLRIAPEAGSIEVGHIHYSPKLQKTPAATEAMYLMMRHAFEVGYRRYEWKCDALNAPSRAAAQRLGFSYEGVFRQASTYKGRNRDTAWFACIDSEWPALQKAFVTWLDAGNFDHHGRQRVSLSELTKPILQSS